MKINRVFTQFTKNEDIQRIYISQREWGYADYLASPQRRKIYRVLSNPQRMKIYRVFTLSTGNDYIQIIYLIHREWRYAEYLTDPNRMENYIKTFLKPGSVQ